MPVVLRRHELQAVGGAARGLALAPQVERARAGHEAQVGPELPAPGVERLGAAPEPQEHVLHDVLGLRRVAEDPQGGGVDGAMVLVVDGAEPLRDP